MSVPSLLDPSRQGPGPQLDHAVPDNKVQAIHAVSEENPDPDFQEGGLRGWLTVLGAFLLQFCSFGYTDAFGVYQDYYTRIYITNQSASAIAWIGSINAFLATASGVYAGILYDQGYFYELLYGGSFLISFSLFMLSLAKPNHLYQNFLAQGIGMGLGTGVTCVPIVAVLSLYFKKKQTLAMTWASSGASLGALIHPIMLNYLFNSSRLGFGGTTRVSAGMVTVMILIACMLMRPKLSPPTKQPPSMTTLIRKIYKDWVFLVLCIGYFFFAVGFYFPLFYLQLYATKHSISPNLAFNTLVIMNGSSFLGRLSPGFFSHLLSVVNMLTAAALCCTILIFSMLRLTNIPSLVTIAVLYGYFAGIYLTLQAPIISFLITDVSELGARLGISFTFCAMGALVGPPIHGSLLSNDFIWWRPEVVSGIFALIGTSLFAVLPFIKKRMDKRLVDE